MSDTEIKGDNYISTSDTYVGVDSSRVLVNNAKTKFNFKYNSSTKAYTIKFGAKFVALDTQKPAHVIVGEKAQNWVINIVKGHPSTYTISPAGDASLSLWCDLGPGVKPRWVYDQVKGDSSQPHLEFLISPN